MVGDQIFLFQMFQKVIELKNIKLVSKFTNFLINKNYLPVGEAYGW